MRLAHVLTHTARHLAPSARRLVAAALGLALASGLAVAAAAAPAHASSSAGPTLRVEADTAFSTFNPFIAYFDGDLNVISNIYPTLTAINEQGVPVPYLATKWTTSAGQAHAGRSRSGPA